MTLGSDKSSTLLQKIKSTFRGERMEHCAWSAKCPKIFALCFFALNKVIFDYLLHSQFKCTVFEVKFEHITFDYLTNSQFKFIVFDSLIYSQL